MIKIGCDAEFFLLDKEGEPLSAEGLIGGSKWDKLQFDEYTLEEDGLSVELGITPATTAEQYSKRIAKALKHVTGEGYNVSLNASEKFSELMRNTPQGIESGCMPSFNAITQSVNPQVYLRDDEYRYAGYHQHIGLGKKEDDWIKDYDPEKLVYSFEYHVGIPYLKMDNDTRRVKKFGMPGSFRIKPYGVEVRSLSSRWLFSDKHRKNIFNGTMRAAKECNNLTLAQVKEVKDAYHAIMK